MADALNSSQMGRKQNSRRNKSSTSIGSKKTRLTSSSSIIVKFQPNVDGYHAFLLCVAKLGKNGQEFTWNDIRSNYHKETSRNLTNEEINHIFSTKGKTKREVLELPSVKKFLESTDGAMHCRFKCIPQSLEEVMKHQVNLNTPLAGSESGSCQNVASTTSLHSSNGDSSDVASAIPTDKNGDAIEISTDCEPTVKSAPTSDLSKSEYTHGPLSQTSSIQSNVTEDEGWVSGKEVRSTNSSPLIIEEENGVLKQKSGNGDGEDEVFEAEVCSLSNQNRMEAGSDECDGVVVVAEEEEIEERAYEPPRSPIVVTSSLEAAFEAVVQSYENTASVTMPMPNFTRLTEEVKVHATPKKVVPDNNENNHQEQAQEEVLNGNFAKKNETAEIRKLIQKFDKPVDFAEVSHTTSATPNGRTIYSKVLEEIGESPFSSPEPIHVKNEEHKDGSVIFRTTPTHSKVLMEGKDQLNAFVAEQKAKSAKKEKKMAENSESDIGFSVKEQSSMSSLDREYFESRMCPDEDLFEELGIRDVDGFTPLPTDRNDEGALETAERSVSNESAPTSEGLITVIERKPISEAERESCETPKSADVRKQAVKVEDPTEFESDGDIPYSLCSEDEGEPMTMIEKSMKSPVISHSAEQLSSPRDAAVQKLKTVLVNVELESAKKREMAVDVTTPLKQRIEALKAAVAGVQAESPEKSENVEDASSIVHMLNRNEELETSVLEFKPHENATNADGSMRARSRQARFIRGGCCLVM